MRPDTDLLWSTEFDAAGQASDVDHEIHPGVRIRRRAVLQVGALAAIACSAPVHGTDSRFPYGTTPTLGFEPFLDQVEAHAKRAVAQESPIEDAYLYQVASLMTRLSEVPLVEGQAFGKLQGLKVGRHAHRTPISVLELQMEPHAVIPIHNHNGYAGNLVGLEGSVRITSYEPAEELDSPTPTEAFSLRESCDLLMTPGRIATLSTTRDNFHGLVAGPNGARALDIFTFFKTPGPSGFFELDPKASDAERRIYRAHPRD